MTPIYKKIYVAIILIAACALSLTAGPDLPRPADPKRPKTPVAQVRATAMAPDMAQIKAEVTDPSSRYYYPKLMARYEQNETIMKLDEYRRLYLGMVFQEDYDPYRRSPFNTKVEELYYRDNHTRAELDTIIAYAERALDDDPFDLQQMNYLIYALRKREKVNRANIWQYRLNHILEAIMSTGTGQDSDNAWVVINPKHEYNIINFHNAVASGVEYVEPYYEFVKISSTDEKTRERLPEGYYFNIRYILDEYYRKHPEAASQQ